jgi:TetR/AcrR family transcriptional regulator of autoinduction and epiphytic fitness
MDKIAEVAKVSKRTVYNHFESKEDLVAEILGTMMTKRFANLTVSFDPEHSVQDQLVKLISEHMDAMACEEFIDLVRVAFAHFINNPEYMLTHFEKYMPEETPVQQLLNKAIAAGKLKDIDVLFASEQLMNMVKGQSFWPQLMRMKPALSEKERSHLIESSVAMFMSYYGN